MPGPDPGRGTDRFREALAPVLRSMDLLGIRWCLTGSMVSAHYGVPRATMDVDLVAEVRPAHVRPLCEALADRYYASPEAMVSAVGRRGSFNLIHLESALKVDVFVRKDEPWDRESFSRRRLEEVHPFGKCFVPRPEDLLLGKLAWYEKGGRVSDRQWSDIRGVLRIQGDVLDREYLHRWARELHLEEPLARALEEPGTNMGRET